MDSTAATEPSPELVELTDAELAGVVGGNDRVDAAKSRVYRAIGMCECGFAH